MYTGLSMLDPDTQKCGGRWGLGCSASFEEMLNPVKVEYPCDGDDNVVCVSSKVSIGAIKHDLCCDRVQEEGKRGNFCTLYPIDVVTLPGAACEREWDQAKTDWFGNNLFGNDKFDYTWRYSIGADKTSESHNWWLGIVPDGIKVSQSGPEADAVFCKSNSVHRSGFEWVCGVAAGTENLSESAGLWYGNYSVPGAAANQSLSFTISFESGFMHLNENNRGRLRSHEMLVAVTKDSGSEFEFNTSLPVAPSSGSVTHVVSLSGDSMSGSWNDGRNSGGLEATRQSMKSFVGQVDLAFSNAGVLKAELTEYYQNHPRFPTPATKLEINSPTDKGLDAVIELHDSGSQFSVQFRNNPVPELRERQIVFSVEKSPGRFTWSCYTDISNRLHLLGSCIPIELP